jgi:hypothetical protein
MRVKQCGWLLGSLACVAVMASQASAANQLANPGFEDPVTSDGPPFVGSWEAFNGGAGTSSNNSTTTPRNGLQDLRLAITNTDNTFAGAFQDVPGVVPGTPVVFSGWHMTSSNPLDLTSEVRIEWRNSVSNTEISRTPNLNPVATLGQYTEFSLPSTVPAGVDTARVVYAIQTFSGGPTNNGIVFVDDTFFDVVPEPATFALGGIAVLFVTGVRRRR